MTLPTQPADTDLWLPRPPTGQILPADTIHTYYFGFSVADQALGAFVYLRCQPAFGFSQGGVLIFRGTDNLLALDMEYVDYEMAMPWPEVDDGRIVTANGLVVEFPEPGQVARVSYSSTDDMCTFDMVQTAISPLVARGHAMPGEDEHGESALQPGGSEQFMRVEGELTLDGQTWTMDPYAIRDRSWSQVRSARRLAVEAPPMAWSPMCFDSDLMLNQYGYESPETARHWSALYPQAAAQPNPYWGWISDGTSALTITRVDRRVRAYHPRLHAALSQEMEIEDETGDVHRFTGEARALAMLPGRPNVAAVVGVYRWVDEAGRVSIQTYQEVAYEKFMRTMARARRTNGES